jgi:hypothetical protein
MRDERRGRLTVDQSRSDVLTLIMGARRAWTVSMISALSLGHNSLLGLAERARASGATAER